MKKQLGEQYESKYLIKRTLESESEILIKTCQKMKWTLLKYLFKVALTHLKNQLLIKMVPSYVKMENLI